MKTFKAATSNVINMRNSMVVKGDDSTKIDDLNKAISEIEAEENRQIILKHFKGYSENPENINLTQMWKQ